MTSPAASYCAAMDDIKRRLLRVSSIVKGHSPLGPEDLDTEVACLLIRKSLEQLAFASLTAHRDAYTAVFDDFQTTWRAKRLLERLEKVNPNFYPEPMVLLGRDEIGLQFKDRESGYLTKEEFSFLYDACSQALHARNPFSLQSPIIDFGISVFDWVERIRALLNWHRVQIYGLDKFWMVQMDHPEDGKAHAFAAGPVRDDQGEPVAITA